MINVVDRIPTKPNEFELEDLGGGRVKLTRADEPSEAGTPINRGLFENVRYFMHGKIVKYSQTLPVLSRSGAAHETTIWLSDSHTEKYNNIRIGTSGTNAEFPRGSDPVYRPSAAGMEFDLEAEYYCQSPFERYPSSVKLFTELPIVDEVGTVTLTFTTGMYSYFREFIFDGYKLIVKQSYTAPEGADATKNGSWDDVVIHCRGRVK